MKKLDQIQTINILFTTSFVCKGIKVLPDKERSIIEMHHALNRQPLERSWKFISKELNMTEAAVQYHYKIAVEKLTQILNLLYEQQN